MGLRDRNIKTNAADSRFIGRENILEDFAREWEKPISASPRFIVNLHGLGGIGKSRLLQQFLSRHTDETMIVCTLDANFDDLNEPLAVLKTIMRKTRKNGQVVKFEETQRLLTRFDKLVNDAAKSSGDLPHALAQLAVKGAQLGGELFGGTETGKLVRGMSEPVAELAEAGIDQMASLWREAKDERDRKLLEAPVREITGKFVHELNQMKNNGEKFVLAIDTYEKVSNQLNQWLLRDVLGESITPAEFDLRLLIAGREPLTEVNRHWHDEWGDMLLEFNVEPFTLAETGRFLNQRRDITDSEIVEKLYAVTEGYPFWLDLWANSGIDPEHFFSTGHLQKVEDRLFEMFSNEKHQLWLRQAAIFRRFNQDLLSSVLDEEAREAFEWLVHQSSLVESSESHWKIHDLARKVILTNLRNRSQALLTEPANKILRYYSEQMQNPWENWRDLRLCLELPEPDIQNLVEMSYYTVLVNCKISDNQLDMILRITDSGLENANELLNATAQACNDIELAFDENFANARSTLNILNEEFDEKGLDALTSNFYQLTYSNYQKAILLNRIAKAYGFKLKHTEKALSCFANIHQAYTDYENACLAYGRLIMHEKPEVALKKIELVLKNNSSHKEAILRKGDCYNEVKKYEDAIEQYKKALELDPQYHRAYVNWAWTLRNMNLHEDAIEVINKAIALKPNHAWAFNFWGNRLLSLNRHDEAIEKFKESLQANPSFYLAHGNWGLCLAKTNRHDEAIEHYKKAIEVNPEYVWAFGSWGESLAKLDRHDEAIEQYKKAIEIKHDYAWAYGSWGASLAKLDCYEEAIELYKKAIEIKPDYIWAYSKLGQSLSKLNRYEAAIEKYKQAIEIKPDYAWAYWSCGENLAKLGRYNEAIEHYKDAIEIDPSYYWAYMNWGDCLKKLNHREAAIELYKKAIEIKPDYDWAYVAIGKCLSDMDSHLDAIEQFQKAAEIEPEKAYIYKNLGDSLSELDKFQEAIEQYSIAIGIDQKYSAAYNNRGLAFSHVGMFKQAIEDYDKALELEPNELSSIYNLGITKQRFNDPNANKYLIKIHEICAELPNADLGTTYALAGLAAVEGKTELALQHLAESARINSIATYNWARKDIAFSDMRAMSAFQTILQSNRPVKKKHRHAKS